MQAALEVQQVASRSEVIHHSSSWQIDTLYSGDELINVYLRGKTIALDNIKKMYLDTIDKEFEIITNSAVQLLDYLREIGVKVHDLYLRFNDIGDYEMLTVVDEKCFTDTDLIDKSYDKSGAIMEEVYNRHFNLDISFIEKTKYFNKKRVVCDGYGITYVGEK